MGFSLFETGQLIDIFGNEWRVANSNQQYTAPGAPQHAPGILQGSRAAGNRNGAACTAPQNLIFTGAVTLRSFLSSVLNCDPMRVSKKFSGGGGIGKQVFVKSNNPAHRNYISQATGGGADLGRADAAGIGRLHSGLQTHTTTNPVTGEVMTFIGNNGVKMGGFNNTGVVLGANSAAFGAGAGIPGGALTVDATQSFSGDPQVEAEWEVKAKAAGKDLRRLRDAFYERLRKGGSADDYKTTGGQKVRHISAR